MMYGRVLMGAAGSVREALEEATVVDAHSHLREIGDLRPMSFAKLLDDSFVHLCLRVADGSPNALGTKLDLPLDTDSWTTIQDVVRRVATNSFYRWLVAGTFALHGMEYTELSESALARLTTEIADCYDTDGWLTASLDRARIQSVIWDPFWLPGQTSTPEPRVRPSLRVSSAMGAYHPDASDYEGANLIRDWARAFDLDIASLDDLEDLIDAVMLANIRAGARSLKVPIAYERTLAVGRAPRVDAAGIFGRSPEAVSKEERLLFGDYILRFFLDRARDHGLVVQVHVGLARLEDSHPLQLLPLLREFPNVVFDLFHGGYPWIREVAALAHSYPNVRLNLVWLPLISSDAAVAALREWIQVIPQVDRISWGSDARTPEETFGALLAAKHSISLALGQLVDEGYLTLAAAIEAGESILAGGARSIYGLPDRPIK